MEAVLIDIMKEIIDLVEEEKMDIYGYKNDKFYIIDRDNNIDFQAKLSPNNYYIKDNISEISIIKVKKYINKNTTVQQILIEDEDEKCFYSFIERDNYTKLVRAIRTDGKSQFVCNNLDVLNHSWKEIEGYADEIFEDREDMDDIPTTKLEISEIAEGLSKLEDDIIKDAFGYGEDYDNEYYEDYEEDYEEDLISDTEEDYNKKFDYELKQIEENEKYGLSNIFENNRIQDYEKYYLKTKKEMTDDYEEATKEYTEALEGYYKGYQLIINGTVIEGKAKERIIADCEAAVEDKAFEFNKYDTIISEFKAVIDAVQRRDFPDDNDDLEK